MLLDRESLDEVNPRVRTLTPKEPRGPPWCKAGHVMMGVGDAHCLPLSS